MRIEHWKVNNAFNLFNFQTQNIYEKQFKDIILTHDRYFC